MFSFLLYYVVIFNMGQFHKKHSGWGKTLIDTHWTDHIFFLMRVSSTEDALKLTSGKKHLYILGLRFSISPSNEYSGLISFRTDWFKLPAVQGTLKSLLQPHS